MVSSLHGGTPVNSQGTISSLMLKEAVMLCSALLRVVHGLNVNITLLCKGVFPLSAMLGCGSY